MTEANIPNSEKFNTFLSKSKNNQLNDTLNYDITRSLEYNEFLNNNNPRCESKNQTDRLTNESIVDENKENEKICSYNK